MLCYDYQLSAFALCTVLYCLEHRNVISATADLILFPRTRVQLTLQVVREELLFLSQVNLFSLKASST